MKRLSKVNSTESIESDDSVNLNTETKHNGSMPPKQTLAPPSELDNISTKDENPITEAASTQQSNASSYPADLKQHRGAKLIRQFELPLLLVSGLVPALGIWTFLDRALFTGAFTQTTIAIIIATCLSWLVLKKLRDHANARHLSYVLPINIGAFLGIISAMALMRLPYSGSLFVSGAVCTVMANFVLEVYSRRLVKQHFIISGGRTQRIAFTEHFRPAPSLNELEHFIESKWKDWVIVADLHYPHSEHTEKLFAKAALSGIPVYHFRQVAEAQSGQVKISHLSENDLGSLIPDASYTFFKRVIDLTGSLIMMPVFLPIFLFIGLIIKLDSSGPAFFVQERIGFRGKKFRMVKFRTMQNREAISEKEAKLQDAMTQAEDNRITRIGSFMRKTRIDELPQIFNILLGDMSLIGPRPEACALSEWYEAELPFYSYRHIVRPGITGWAQVNQGHVTDVGDVLSKLRYDFYYIKNYSLWLDLLVGLKTLRVIATGLGAK